MRLPLFIAMFLALAARLAHGYYVIPYELRPNGPGTAEVYTVLVILGNHYDHYFGEPDGLTDLLAKSYHAPTDTFAEDYLRIPQGWYLDQIAKPEYERVYGPNAQAIADGLRQFEPLSAGRTSAVVITEHRNTSKVLAFLRVDMAGPDGKLSSERHFLGKGLIKPFDQPEPEFKWRSVSDFQANSQLRNFHLLQSASESERLHYWLEGENAELKNYAMDPAMMRKLFRHGYRIARAHKLFTWGSGLFPKKITHWPNGTPIPHEAHERYGVRLSHLWIDAYSQFMARLYGGMDFELWGDKINNEHTYFQDLFFLRQEAAVVEKKLDLLSSLKAPDAWLVYDESTALTLRAGNCRHVSVAADELNTVP